MEISLPTFERTNERTNDILSTVLNLLPWVSMKRQPGKPVGEKWRFGNAGRCYSDGISMWRVSTTSTTEDVRWYFRGPLRMTTPAPRLEIICATPAVRDIIVQRALPRRNFKNRRLHASGDGRCYLHGASRDRTIFLFRAQRLVALRSAESRSSMALRQTDGQSVVGYIPYVRVPRDLMRCYPIRRDPPCGYSVLRKRFASRQK